MGQLSQPSATLADLNAINQKVTTRTTSWLDLAERAWGAEFKAPDRDIYVFGNGLRRFDSTDRGDTGLYGGVAPTSVVVGSPNQLDMPMGFLATSDGSTLILSQDA